MKLLLVSESSSVHHQQWYMSYPVWRQLSSRTILVCMTYTMAECTVNKLLMMNRGTVRNTYSCQNKFVKLVHLVGFIIKKFVTMHGHMNIKRIHCLRLKELDYFTIVTGSLWWAEILVKPDHYHDGVDDNGHDADGVGETSSVRKLWNNVHSDASWGFSVLFRRL
jgi:hypothetical protein